MISGTRPGPSALPQHPSERSSGPCPPGAPGDECHGVSGPPRQPTPALPEGGAGELVGARTLLRELSGHRAHAGVSEGPGARTGLVAGTGCVGYYPLPRAGAEGSPRWSVLPAPRAPLAPFPCSFQTESLCWVLGRRPHGLVSSPPVTGSPGPRGAECAGGRPLPCSPQDLRVLL